MKLTDVTKVLIMLRVFYTSASVSVHYSILPVMPV